MKGEIAVEGRVNPVSEKKNTHTIKLQAKGY